MRQAGAALIAHYLAPDRLPVSRRWSRKHAHSQGRLCALYAAPVIGEVACVAALDLSALAEEAWVGGRVGSPWFRTVRQACRTVGFDPRVMLTSDDYRAVQAFAAAGLGVAVIPGLAVARPVPGVEVRRLRTGAPARRICAVYPDDSFQPPAVRTMITILEKITQRLRNPPMPHD